MTRHVAMRICRVRNASSVAVGFRRLTEEVIWDGQEVNQIANGTDLSLAVSCGDADIRYVRALIVGPMSTPYQFGFYEFMVTFNEDYPTEPPSIRALSTNGGATRMNPNINANGHICLSTIGTYSAGRRGLRRPEWSSAQCLESLLVSIQSLMSEHPYLNEPGFEVVDSEEDLAAMESYTAKVRHESLRLTVIEPLECILGLGSGTVKSEPNEEERLKSVAKHFMGEDDSGDEDERKFGKKSSIGPNAFNDLRKRMFLWYFECHKHTIAMGKEESTHGAKFYVAPFERPGNMMSGRFNYVGLDSRLHALKDALMQETASWSVDWTSEMKAGVVHCLRRQYEQITTTLQAEKDFSIDLRLDNGNPFVWNLTYLGRPMTQFDGCVVNMKMHMSPRFPREQPRVFIDPPPFHHRVSPTGIIYYMPKRGNSMRYHIDAIVEALESEPPFDPRTTVNPEATRLFWGSPAERRLYRRKLRVSLEKNAE